MNILIATDGSGEASTALHTAARVLGPDYRNFTLLCVAPSYPKLRRGGRQRQEYERRILSEITQAQSSLSAGDQTSCMTHANKAMSMLK